MNYEQHFRIEKKNIHPRRLLNACQKFADILANDEWFDPENREVSIVRSFTESIGAPSESALPNGVFVNETRVKTQVEFLAEKELVEMPDDEDRIPVLEETYTVSAKVRELLEYSDIPKHILGLLREVTNIEGEEDDEPEITLAEPSFETLRHYAFEREHEVGYVIDEEGEIDDYYVMTRYLADDKVIDEEQYSWGGATVDSSEVPTLVLDKKVVEWKHNNSLGIDEDDILTFLSNFEQVIHSVLTKETFDEISNGMQLEDAEHPRRVLGIIAMTAVGFKRFKI